MWICCWKIREEEQEDRAAKAAEKEREIAMKLQEQKEEQEYARENIMKSYMEKEQSTQERRDQEHYQKEQEIERARKEREWKGQQIRAQLEQKIEERRVYSEDLRIKAIQKQQNVENIMKKREIETEEKRKIEDRHTFEVRSLWRSSQLTASVEREEKWKQSEKRRIQSYQKRETKTQVLQKQIAQDTVRMQSDAEENLKIIESAREYKAQKVIDKLKADQMRIDQATIIANQNATQREAFRKNLEKQRERLLSKMNIEMKAVQGGDQLEGSKKVNQTATPISSHANSSHSRLPAFKQQLQTQQQEFTPQLSQSTKSFRPNQISHKSNLNATSMQFNNIKNRKAHTESEHQPAATGKQQKVLNTTNERMTTSSFHNTQNQFGQHNLNKTSSYSNQSTSRQGNLKMQPLNLVVPQQIMLIKLPNHRRISDKSVQSSHNASKTDLIKVESNQQGGANNGVGDNSNTVEKIANDAQQKDTQDNIEQTKQDQSLQNHNELNKQDQEQQNQDGLNRSQVMNNSHYYSYNVGKKQTKKQQQQQQQQQWTTNNNNNNNSSIHNMSMKMLNDSQYSKFDSASCITRAYEKDVPRSKIDMLKELNSEGYASKKSNSNKQQHSKIKPNIQYNSSPFGSVVEEILKSQVEITQATEKLLGEFLDKKDGLKNNEVDKNASGSDKGIEELAEELNRIYKVDEARSGQNLKILGLAK